MVASYLQKQGFKIYPIYPKMDEILGEKVYRNLNEIKDDIDIVVMFRKAEFAETLVDEVMQKGAKTLWLQLDIINDKAKEKALQNNINFVQNRCIKIEHMRLKDDFVE
ncbi:CoA-binding domain protein [Campylobacter pinnipediorum subsp. caledonicus]|uniref:CoA-binding domain protein n=2 Tax=Campylobacter TaxID=194 RepID=A0A1S6U5N9_9BACT|nr:CoA-binding protein [Campylobacter pinnipediorum]AQW87023.1 CoA-binding domain protein [Campylobacter pinnipediorum subsp. caledonicus]